MCHIKKANTVFHTQHSGVHFSRLLGFFLRAYFTHIFFTDGMYHSPASNYIEQLRHSISFFAFLGTSTTPFGSEYTIFSLNCIHCVDEGNVIIDLLNAYKRERPFL